MPLSKPFYSMLYHFWWSETGQVLYFENSDQNALRNCHLCCNYDQQRYEFLQKMYLVRHRSLSPNTARTAETSEAKLCEDFSAWKENCSNCHAGLSHYQSIITLEIAFTHARLLCDCRETAEHRIAIILNEGESVSMPVGSNVEIANAITVASLAFR
jgi:hypothetical protein